MKTKTDVSTLENDIDAVALMRKLRSDVNDQMRGKTYEQQREYLDEQLGRCAAKGPTSGKQAAKE